MIERALSLNIFMVLDSIAKNHGIIDKKWSQYSKLPRPRISEIRSLAKKKRRSDDVDRIFSVPKCSALIGGLINILGGDIVRKELSEALTRLKDKREMACLIVLNLPEEKLNEILRLADSGADSRLKKKKKPTAKKKDE